jgi:hypothetical protein
MERFFYLSILLSIYLIIYLSYYLSIYIIGLSYRECTWETVADINDDAKIVKYHELNDKPPVEPPMTQAEIQVEINKDRRYTYRAYHI